MEETETRTDVFPRSQTKNRSHLQGVKSSTCATCSFPQVSFFTTVPVYEMRWNNLVSKTKKWSWSTFLLLSPTTDHCKLSLCLKNKDNAESLQRSTLAHAVLQSTLLTLEWDFQYDWETTNICVYSSVNLGLTENQWKHSAVRKGEVCPVHKTNWGRFVLNSTSWQTYRYKWPLGRGPVSLCCFIRWKWNQ